MLKRSLVCRMPLQYVVYKCVAIGVAYVAPFYFRDSHARNHPSTIKFRMASTIATSLLAWLPLYHEVYNKVTHSTPRMLHVILQCGMQHMLLTSVQHNPPEHAYVCTTACLCMTPMRSCAADGVSQRPIAAFAWAQGRRAPASCCQANPADSKPVCWPIATASADWQDTARGSQSPAISAQFVRCACHRRVLLPSLHVTVFPASGKFGLSSGRHRLFPLAGPHATRPLYLATQLVYIWVAMTDND